MPGVSMVDRSFVPSIGLCLIFIAGYVDRSGHVRRSHGKE